MINRDNFISELILREHVRRRILSKHQQKVVTENKLRNVIRQLLSEAEQGEAPAESTGINVLADLLKKIVPVLEDEYRMLTSSPEQRTSFRAHIIQAVKNSLAPIVATNAEGTNESIEYEIDFSLLSEKITIDVGEEESEEEVEGEFIDIEDTAEEKDEFGIKDQNETGRNFAKGAFDKVEKQIVDAYDKLGDENDQKLFYDYLLTNLMLYFDKFEDELIAELPQTSTEEYEQEKEAGEDAEVTPDEGGEEEPEAEAGGEEEAGEEEEELEL
tara:strand:+ start:2258 stop:3073 length:816 start_codon:yes stop_codon:yes gene_type:complete